MHFPALKSQSLAVASQAPEMKWFLSGEIDTLEKVIIKEFEQQQTYICIPHNVTVVISKLRELCSLFNIPQNTSHITTASNNLSITEEAAARQVTNVGVQFSAYTDGHFSSS